MDRKSVVRATNLNTTINYRVHDLRDIRYYEKHYFDYPIEVRLKRTGGIGSITTNLFLRDEKLKKEILNLIKIHFVAEIQRMEKELKEL